MKRCGYAVLAALAAGCAPWQSPDPVSPTSYASARAGIERTVGRLRRVAVLVVGQAPPRACVPTSDEAAWIAVPDEELTAQVLAARRGYEVVESGVAAGEAEAVAADVLRLVKEPDAVGPALASHVAALRKLERIDALIVVHGRSSCGNANEFLRGSMTLFTLGLHAWSPDPNTQQLYPSDRAWIIEAAGVRVVWRRAIGMLGTASTWLRWQDDTRSRMEILFEDLESAVPRLLVR